MQQDLFTDNENLDKEWLIKQLRKELHEARKDGCICPACDQNVKQYKIKFNSSMAHCLIWMTKLYKDKEEWIDLPRVGTRAIINSRSHGKMVHWGLVEPKPNEDNPDKKDSGLWKPTAMGISFALGVVTIPKYVELYNNSVEGFSTETTSIEEALGTKFSYKELMQTNKGE